MRLRHVLLLLLPALPLAAGDDGAAARLVILANASDPASVGLARHYAKRRGVPESALIALPMPLAETVSWGQFVAEIYNPLLEILIERGRFHGMLSDQTDAIGRRRAVVTGHDISHLLTVRGVPLRIANDLRVSLKPADPRMPPAYAVNGAALDSELALLAQPGSEIIGLEKNPLFGRDAPFSLELAKVVKVTRFDGGGEEATRRLLDDCIAAERDGLAGRAYVDYGGGPSATGNQWLKQAADALAAARMDTDVDTSPATLPATARFDNAAVYLGWYSNTPNGPFALSETRFAPGAVALHIYSFSADTLRNPVPKRWCETLLARGAAAVFGNVAEPYLPFTHQPHLLMKALLRGDALGDAACYAMPVLGWQGVVFGDPLYRPFAVPLERQWERRDKLPPEARSRLVLRRMAQLDLDGERNQAIWLGLAEQKRAPTLHVALALAKLQRDATDTVGELEALAPVLSRLSFDAATAPLAAIAARRLVALEKKGDALLLWKKILFSAGLPEAQRVPFLREGIAAAKAAGEPDRAARWEEELQRLLPPPPPPKKPAKP